MNEIRSYCEYCGGNTYLDARGNCAACGAPKHYKISGYAEITSFGDNERNFIPTLNTNVFPIKIAERWFY